VLVNAFIRLESSKKGIKLAPVKAEAFFENFEKNSSGKG